MTWNYRILRSVYNVCGEEEEIHAVHEVYYDSAGEIVAYSDAPSPLAGNDLEDLKGCLNLLALAFEKPILDKDSIVFAEMDGVDDSESTDGDT